MNLGAARRAITAAFQTRTLSLTRGGVTQTSRCGLAPRSGTTQPDGGADVERGEYILTLPAQSSLVLVAGEIVVVEDRRLRIVWAPARSNLNLSDRYGATEVR